MHKLYTNWRNIHHFAVMENTNLSHCRLFWETNGNEKYKTTNLSSVSHHHFHIFFCWIKSLFWLFDKMWKLKVGNKNGKLCYMFKLYLVKIWGWTFTLTFPCTLFFTVIFLCFDSSLYWIFVCPVLLPSPTGTATWYSPAQMRVVPPLSSEIYCSSASTFLLSSPARQAKNLLRKLCLEGLEHFRCKFLLIK